jgi:hypothetical protein
MMLLLAACTPAATPARTDVVQAPGNIELNQGPPNDALLGGGGNGTVFFNGRSWPFSIGGLGVEGSSIAILRTTGQVYDLQDLAKFPGNYWKAPSAGAAPGLWLRNEHGTLMRIAAPPGGRLPDIGLDGVRVILQ